MREWEFTPHPEQAPNGMVLVSDTYLATLKSYCRRRCNASRQMVLAELRAMERECREAFGKTATQRPAESTVSVALDVGFDDDGTPVDVEMHAGAVTEGTCPYCGLDPGMTRERLYAMVSQVMLDAVKKAASDCGGNPKAFVFTMVKMMGENYREIGERLGISKQAVGKYKKQIERNNAELAKFVAAQWRGRGEE